MKLDLKCGRCHQIDSFKNLCTKEEQRMSAIANAQKRLQKEFQIVATDPDKPFVRLQLFCWLHLTNSARDHSRNQ
jgi:hypothetical protein